LFSLLSILNLLSVNFLPIQSCFLAIAAHSRHLKLARELGDSAGEARANLNLANDFVAQDDLPKALYFLIRNYRLSINVSSKN
jgi:hypothetical protein